MITKTQQSTSKEIRGTQWEVKYVTDLSIHFNSKNVDYEYWYRICTDSFQNSIMDGELQDIEMFDRILLGLESCEHTSLNMQQFQRLLISLGTSKHQYQNAGNFELYRATETCENELKAIIYKTMLNNN